MILMKFITKQDESDLIPGSIDISLAEAKGLAINGVLTEQYFELQSIYYHLLELYIGSKIDLVSCENNLMKENIKPVAENDKDIYQYLSDYQYFYIRNTLFVEKLSNEIIAKLININFEKLTEESLELIKETFKDVITATDFNLDEFNLHYGPLSSDYMAGNKDLIIGFRCAEEDDSSYENEDKWFEDLNRRRYIIDQLCEQLTKVLTSNLNVNCRIIEYFEESVKKKSDTIGKQY